MKIPLYQIDAFTSRMFGIPEDSVTGSAHCELTPCWAKRLGKERLEARQISPRAVTCLEGVIEL